MLGRVVMFWLAVFLVLVKPLDGGFLPTSPLLVGIRPGSQLPVKKPVALTCSTEYTSSIESIEWIVNGIPIWSDFNLLTESGQIISNLLFVPQMDDSLLECKIKGNKARSAHVFFSVFNKPKAVKLQKAEKSEINKILWIPFDIKRLETNRLESSGEETAATYSRDIYQFMQDSPDHAADSLDRRRKQKLHNKKTESFVEELRPISLPLASQYIHSSAHKLNGHMLVLVFWCVLYVLR